MSGGLPREILKWLQSLDLSYSVKNPKRDFSNGFLIAEIFSRYFQHDISLHSFDNGSSLQKKLDNWALLKKFFMKRGISVPQDKIDGVIHCKDEAAQQLVEHVYSQLTSRNVDTLKAAATNSQPSYAKPTTTSMISESIKDSEAKTSELLATQGKAAAINEEHDMALREEKRKKRQAEDEKDKHHARVQTRQLGDDDGSAAPGVQFEPVKVKNVDRSVSELRAAMNPQSARSGGGAAPVAQDSAPTRSVESMLGAELMVALQQHGGGGQFANVAPDELWPTFVAQLKTTPCDLIVAVLNDLASKAMGKVVQGCLRSPRDFWKLIAGALIPAVHELHSQPRCAPVVQFLSKLAQGLLQADPTSCWELFVDFGLSKICALLRKESGGAMRSLMLSILYSFCSDTIAAHITAIKALQDELKDQGVFMLSLSSLIELETAFDDDLLDLYLYYCVVGLGMASAKLQSAALSMLQSCAVQQPALVLTKLPLVASLCKSGWWEVEAQLIVLASTLLETLDQDPPPAIQEDGSPPPPCPPLSDAVDLLKKIILPADKKRLDVLRVAACKIAPCLSSHKGALQEIYASVLLAMSGPALREILDKSSTPMLSVTNASIVAPLGLNSPPLQWDASIVFEGITAKAGSFTAAHLEVLLACAPDVESSTLLSSCAGSLFASLADPELCSAAVEVVTAVLEKAPVAAVSAALPALVKSLLLLFPNGDDSCKEQVAVLVIQIAEMQGGAVKGALVAALQAAPGLAQAPELAPIMA